MQMVQELVFADTLRKVQWFFKFDVIGNGLVNELFHTFHPNGFEHVGQVSFCDANVPGSKNLCVHVQSNKVHKIRD